MREIHTVFLVLIGFFCVAVTADGQSPTSTEDFSLVADDGESGDEFGISSSISGSKSIVGAPFANAAYVYNFTGSSWNQEEIIVPFDIQSNDDFGSSVSISGFRAIIGATKGEGLPPNPVLSGSAYVYRFNGGVWFEEAKLLASDPGFQDSFGSSVSISGDRAIVGASSNDDNGSASGSAYIYHLENGIWAQEQKLVASDASGGNRYGQSVSISGNVAIVGAKHADSNIGR